MQSVTAVIRRTFRGVFLLRNAVYANDGGKAVGVTIDMVIVCGSSKEAIWPIFRSAAIAARPRFHSVNRNTPENRY